MWQIHARLRSTFNSGKTKPIAFRKAQLLQLFYLLEDNKKLFQDALYVDLKRQPAECDL